MQSWLRVVLLFFALMVYDLSPSWGHAVDYKVYWLGKEINLTLKTNGGRVYGLQSELFKLAEELFPDVCLSGDADNQWLPFRTFWEELGLKVKWIPEAKAIIISENTEDMTIPEEAQEIMIEALADTLWLRVNSKQELYSHLSQYYTPELIKEIFNNIWGFLQLETDWHSLYQLVDSQVLDRGEDWFLVKVTISESISPDEEPFLIDGIIKLRKLEEGWRIAAHDYYE